MPANIAVAPQRNLRFSGLEFGRGVAASLVVMHHASNILGQPRYGGAAPFDGFMKQFDIGVDFFFVLSGFIITWVHWSDIGRPERLGGYLKRRFTRIFPPYWCVLVPLTSVYFLFPQAGLPSQHDPVNAVVSFFLLPSVVPPVLGVAWTLVYEMFFYAVFAVVLVIGARGWILVALWGAGMVAYAAFGDDVWPQRFFLDTRNLEFLCGIATAVLLRNHRVRLPGITAMAGILAFVTVMVVHFLDLFDLPPICEHAGLGVAGGAIIAGVIEAERSGRLALPAAARLFGAASFSIYLVHPFVESFVLAGAWRYLQHLPLIVVWTVIAAVAIGAGLMFHRFVEVPVIALVRDRLPQRRFAPFARHRPLLASQRPG